MMYIVSLSIDSDVFMNVDTEGLQHGANHHI